jgi:hypothetical protein
MVCPSYKETFQSTSIVHPPCGSTTIPRNRSLNKDGTMKEAQNMLETFNTRLIRANKIHLFRSQLEEILLKGFYENHKRLIFKDHISILINY